MGISCSWMLTEQTKDNLKGEVYNEENVDEVESLVEENEFDCDIQGASYTSDSQNVQDREDFLH